MSDDGRRAGRVVDAKPASPPTHAGAVVVRRTPEGREYLAVSPSSGADEWVLPKGHIEPWETPEQAAIRELGEEAGVQGAIVQRIGTSEYERRGTPVRVAYFLAVYVGAIRSKEQRRVAWWPYAEARHRFAHDDARELLDAAERVAEGMA